MIGILSVMGLILALQSGETESFPMVGKPAPRLELRLADATPIEWKTLQSRKTALFFFCPCEACHEVAKLWAQQEQKSKNQKLKPDKMLQRLIVFAGDADAVLRFQAETGLVSSHIRYALDPDMKAALRYDAMPCPRAFVWDMDSKVQWISPENHGEKPAITPQILLKSVDVAFAPIRKPAMVPRRK